MGRFTDTGIHMIRHTIILHGMERNRLGEKVVLDLLMIPCCIRSVRMYGLAIPL